MANFFLQKNLSFCEKISDPSAFLSQEIISDLISGNRETGYSPQFNISNEKQSREIFYYFILFYFIETFKTESRVESLKFLKRHWLGNLEVARFIFNHHFAANMAVLQYLS